MKVEKFRWQTRVDDPFANKPYLWYVMLAECGDDYPPWMELIELHPADDGQWCVYSDDLHIYNELLGSLEAACAFAELKVRAL